MLPLVHIAGNHGNTHINIVVSTKLSHVIVCNCFKDKTMTTVILLRLYYNTLCMYIMLYYNMDVSVLTLNMVKTYLILYTWYKL